jgi:hypothetical protein
MSAVSRRFSSIGEHELRRAASIAPVEELIIDDEGSHVI